MSVVMAIGIVGVGCCLVAFVATLLRRRFVSRPKEANDG